MPESLTLTLETTESGFPNIWERGGLGSYTVLIANSHGGRKNAIYQTRPSLKTECGRHAMFVVEERDLIAQGQLTGEEQYLNFYKVARLIHKRSGEATAYLEQIPDKEALRKSRHFYEAAVTKLKCERCKHMHYGYSRY